MVAPIRYLSRREQQQKIGILSSTEDEKVLEVVGRVGIGTTIFDAEVQLDVRGTTNISGKLDVVGNAKVTGIVTAAEFVGGGSDLRNLSGTHLVSYASASDISNSALSISGISTYNEVGILTGTYATDFEDQFGYVVATSADGNTIVVGAVKDETSGIGTYGVVYVYDREGNNFNEVGILTGTYATDSGDYFGSSVATSADGKTIIVGARQDGTSGIGTNGLVYVFDRVGNNFNEVGILTGSLDLDHGNIPGFGIAVATSADGKTIVVGDSAANFDNPQFSFGHGVVYVFDREGNNFNEVGILTGTYASNSWDSFGMDVATSADGKTIVVGAQSDELPGFSNTGVVYVFDRVGNNFNEVGILTGTVRETGDLFGSPVATSADGKTIVVGAWLDEIPGSGSGSGVAYVFDRVGNNFNEVGILTGSHASDSLDGFGFQVATSADGKTIVVGAPRDEVGIGSTDTGVVYVYNRVGNNFNQVGILTGSNASVYEDRFGYSLATSADGKTIIVGAFEDEVGIGSTDTGVVYVFDQERQTYVFTDANGNIGIGTANPTSTVHVSGVGTTANVDKTTLQSMVPNGGPRVRVGSHHWDEIFTSIHTKDVTSEIWVEQNSDNDDGADLCFYKSRGVPGAETPVLLGDNIGRINVRGFSTTATTSGAGITLGDYPNKGGSLEWNVDFIGTNPQGRGYPAASFNVKGQDVIRFTVASAGNVGIGTTNPQAPLHLQHNNPRIFLSDTNQAVDHKHWQIGAGISETLRIQALNDNYGGGSQYFDFVRHFGNIEEFRGTKSGQPWFVIHNNLQKVGIGSTVPTANLDVNGTVNVTGVSTFNNLVGIATINPKAKLDVNGTLNVSGISTFNNKVGIATINPKAKLDVNGTLNVSGISTFNNKVGIATINPTASLDVAGSFNVTGVSTFRNNIDIVSTGNTSTITGPSNLILDPAAIGDNTGKVIVLGDLQVDGTQTIIHSTTLEVDDKLISIAKSATNATQANGAGLDINGANATLTYSYTDDRMVFNKDLQASKFYGDGSGLTGIGISQIVGGVSGSLIGDASGSTTYYISATNATSGISSNTYVKSNIVMTGIGSVGIGTTQPTAKLDVAGSFNVSGISTFSGSLDVDGHTNLDDVNVSGISTFSGSLDVDGHTNLDDVNVSGASTFAGNINANGNIVGDSATNISGINSVTATTFYGDGQYLTGIAGTTGTTIFENITVSGNAGIGSLNVTGISTLGTVKISSGIVTAVSGVVTYYGDGSNLSNIPGFAPDADGNLFAGGDAGGSYSPDGSAKSNIFIGCNSGECISTGDYNNFYGWGSGQKNTTGGCNTFLGFRAGQCNTTGAQNVALGHNSMGFGAEHEGNKNAVIGLCAGYCLRNGSCNVFLGACAGFGHTSGCSNNFFGMNAGKCNTSGSCNTFLGFCAGRSSTTGSCNVVIGRSVELPSATGNNQLAIGDGTNRWIAGDSSFNTTIAGIATVYAATGIVSATKFCGDGSCLTGLADGGFSQDVDGNLFAGTNAGGSYDPSTGAACFNIFLGCNSGSSIVGGGNNIFLGCQSGAATDNGNANVFLGAQAGFSNTDGACNVFIGHDAGCKSSTGTKNVFIGECAGNCNTGDCNVNIGNGAACCNKDGNANVFLGAQAGFSVQEADCSVYIGHNAGRTGNAGAAWSPKYNVLIGDSVGYAHTELGCGVLIGKSAGYKSGSTYGISIGYQAGMCDSGLCNIAIGKDALKGATVTGCNNIAIGQQAAQNTDTGCDNVFIGFCAGLENTSGKFNTFLGCGVGACNKTGSWNTFIGIGAGFGLTEGTTNIIIGTNASRCTTTGNDNTIIGSAAGRALVSSCSNTFIGVGAGQCVTSLGENNLFLGANAGRCSSGTGACNIFAGFCAGCGNNDGDNNVFIGTCAGLSNTDGVDNILIGREAGKCLTTGNSNIFIGDESAAGTGDKTGKQNIFLGKGSGKRLTSGCYNIFFGECAGYYNTTASQNIYIGRDAGYSNTTGSKNIAIGDNALYKASGPNADTNVAMGIFAGACVTTGCHNLLIGTCKTGFCITTGGHNTIIGRFAGHGNPGTGMFNVFMGGNAGKCFTSGGKNVIIGDYAGCLLSSGSGNAFLGNYAGRSTASGCYNVFLGRYAGNTNTSGDKNIAIGCNVELPSNSGDCQLGIGNGTDRWITGDSSYNVDIPNTLSKGGGSFKINHPHPTKTNTHFLVHSFIEGPKMDLLYRGRVDLVAGTATVNIDEISNMTEGTFVLLNRDVQSFTTNETGWTAVKSSVSGNLLTITAQDSDCTDTISWMVIGERQDDTIKSLTMTDDDGNLIVEPLKDS